MGGAKLLRLRDGSRCDRERERERECREMGGVWREILMGRGERGRHLPFGCTESGQQEFFLSFFSLFGFSYPLPLVGDAGCLLLLGPRVRQALLPLIRYPFVH